MKQEQGILSYRKHKIYVFFVVECLFIGIFISNAMVNVSTTSLQTNSRPNSFILPLPSAASSTNWTKDGICIVDEANYQGGISMLPDGEGGAYIAWADNRGSDFDLYMQRIDKYGNNLWQEDGLPLSVVTGTQNEVFLIPATEGFYALWSDTRDWGTNGNDIYGQHVFPNGSVEWAPNGKALATHTSREILRAAISDDDNGFIAVWVDDRDFATTNYDIYAQRYNSSGGVVWTDYPLGRPACTAAESQVNPVAIPDGNHGVYIFWEDNRNTATTDTDIYGQHLWKDQGNTLWGTAAVCKEVCTAIYAQSNIVGTAIDGGVIITWSDYRNAGANALDIYGQKIISTDQWTTDGIPIVTSINNQVPLDIVSDGSGGAYLFWKDYRNSTELGIDLYMGHLNSSGIDLWGPNGTVFCNSVEDQDEISVTMNANGNLLCVYTSEELGTKDIFAQKLDSNGSILEASFPAPLCTAADEQSSLVTSLVDGQTVLVAWEDDRSGVGTDIYSTIFQGQPTAVPSNNLTGPRFQLGAENITFLMKYPAASSGSIKGGIYQVYANNTGDFLPITNLTRWVDGETLQIPINQSQWGTTIYTIEYYLEDLEYYGSNQSVAITILDLAPSTNEPADFNTTLQDQTEIVWFLWDDFGIKNYSVFLEDPVFGDILWQEKSKWTNNTPVYVPILRNSLGVFNYTIYFETISGQLGSDTVTITVVNDTTDNLPSSDKEEPWFPVPDIISEHYPEVSLIALMLAFLAFILSLRPRKSKKETRVPLDYNSSTQGDIKPNITAKNTKNLKKTKPPASKRDVKNKKAINSLSKSKKNQKK